MCKQHYTTNYQAEHQTAVEVYNDILLAALRGYMTVQLAYMILGLRERGSYTELRPTLCGFFFEIEFDSIFSQKNIAKRVVDCEKLFKETINAFGKVFWM